jgi:hypothetical protein
MDGAVRHIDSGRPGTGALTWPPLLGAGTHMTSDPSHELTPPTRPEDVWDKFIDALDRAGQAGGAQGVCVPAVATGTLAGRAFGTLTRDDVRQLARVAQAFGRRGETVITIWEDTQRRLKPPPKRRPQRIPRS